MSTTFAPLAANRRRSGSSAVSQHLKNALAEENACYVLITCTEPAEDGQMQVEMVYEGDATLAAYLLESAQGLIEESVGI